MKKVLALLLAMVMALGFSVTGFAASSSSYSDVPSSHWAFSSIESCTAKGLITGVGGGKFDPEGTLTRAQVAQICFNAYKGKLASTSNQALADVASDAWYYDAMHWVVGNGIVDGSSEEGDIYCYPNTAADRKYVALVLYRLANKMEVALPKTNTAVTFPDITTLSTEYQKAIGELQQAGVISGFPDGRYQAASTLTRSQAAKLFDIYTNIEGLGLVAIGNPVDPPLSSEVFLSKAIYDEIMPYAESLGYRCDSYRDPTNNAWQMTFRKSRTLISLALFPGNDYWDGIAYESYGVGSPEKNIHLYSLDDMKALLIRYTN